jgi:hypothetical protein
MAEAPGNSNLKNLRNEKMARGSHFTTWRMAPRCLGLEY